MVEECAQMEVQVIEVVHGESARAHETDRRAVAKCRISIDSRGVLMKRSDHRWRRLEGCWAKSSRGRVMVGGLALGLLIAGCGSSSPAKAPSSSPTQGSLLSNKSKTVADLTPNPTVASLTTCSVKKTATINVGLIGPLTGSSSSDAVDLFNAATLAKGQLDSAGGVCTRGKRYKFHIVTGDTNNMQTSSVVSAVKLLETTTNLNFVMAAYADTSNFEETLFAKVNMPYLLSGGAAQTAAIISKDPSKYPTIWSRVPSYAAYGTALPPLIEQWVKQGKLALKYGRTVDIMSSQDPYGSSIAQELGGTFTKLGWHVTNLGTSVYGQTSDWSAPLIKIRATPPSVIVNTDWAAGDDAAFQNQFMQQPTNSLVFEQYAPNLGQYQQLVGTNGNGVIYDDLGAAIPGLKSTQQITAKYQSKYGAPGYFSVIGYNELMLYAYCVKQVGDPANRLGIGACIGNLNIETPAGPLKFNQTTHNAAQGSGYMPIGFFQLQNKKPVQIAPAENAQAGFGVPPWMG